MIDTKVKQKEIFKRIKEIMGLKTDKELAEFFEISQTHLSSDKKRGTIPYKKIIEHSVGNYNLEYIFFGKGRVKPPSFDLENDIDYEFLNLVSTYTTPKLKEEIKEKLLKIKELQES